jgi:hypothetical protein
MLRKPKLSLKSSCKQELKLRPNRELKTVPQKKPNFKMDSRMMRRNLQRIKKPRSSKE